MGCGRGDIADVGHQGWRHLWHLRSALLSQCVKRRFRRVVPRMVQVRGDVINPRGDHVAARNHWVVMMLPCARSVMRDSRCNPPRSLGMHRCPNALMNSRVGGVPFSESLHMARKLGRWRAAF
ncbi:hypothetical protein YK56LOC_05720 [Caballeronia sp. HLA56]